jgi:hypothetical protein
MFVLAMRRHFDVRLPSKQLIRLRPGDIVFDPYLFHHARRQGARLLPASPRDVERCVA